MKAIFSARTAVALVLLVFAGVRIGAQAPTKAISGQQLFDLLAAKDREMFGSVMGAYGHCDLQKFESFMAEDVEFYHDQGGLIASRSALLEQSKTVCGKQRRELVPGSLETYPIPGYGAVQAGAHRFFHPVQGSTEETGGTVAAKFLHVWKNKDGEWKITRVISYAH